jgi:nucleoside-diphosphate-sugar epimerase
MRILVTGAAGKIGAHVVQDLVQHGHQIVATDNRPLPPEVRANCAAIIYADIADPLATMTAASGCDGIAHLAAYPSPFRLTSAELLRVNVIGTQNILDAATANGIPRVVLTSSVGALGFSFPTHPCLPDYLPVDVEHPCRPQDTYGVSKRINEECAAAISRRTGITTIVLRPPFVADLAQTKEQGWMRRMIERGLQRRDESLWGYIDVRDQARAYRLSLESSLTGHHIFFTMADDVAVDATPQELAARFLPNLQEQAERLPGHCFYDLMAARDILGFTAELTWRRVLEESIST